MNRFTAVTWHIFACFGVSCAIVFVVLTALSFTSQSEKFDEIGCALRTEGASGYSACIYEIHH